MFGHTSRDLTHSATPIHNMPAPRGPELSEADRGRIIGLHEAGCSYRKIGALMGIDHSTARKTVLRYKNFHTYSSLPRSGRPRKLTDQVQCHIIRALHRYRRSEYRTIAAYLGTVTERQVRKVAEDAGYRRYVACPKPHIKPDQATQQLEWAQQNLGRDWDSVVWTDESSIKTGEVVGRQRVTRLPGEAFLPECIIPTYPHGQKSIMVWGCIAHGRKGPIILLQTQPKVVNKYGRRSGGGINAQGYAEQVISGPLMGFLLAIQEEQRKEIFVVEDGAPPHRGKAARDTRKTLGIIQLPHPPNSPDLNLIEDLWYLLKKQVSCTPGSGNSTAQLWEATQQAWASITDEEVAKYTGTMNEQVQAVIEAKGYNSRF
jgi:transposase